ncbi:hypothetical protein H9Q13_10950 [Pontibacter sp. JH31]|uniref:MORN repeat variant n=1 Tax=Pontibacter aquaedesilientis TaxID=2766980 RepID=A0ABR7XHB2_9BACT|nr:hypothetical protein [Pontibacter aquaedesilientis]MBD1397683.1 hypothetical protein [Pontibacter aquaedesilientis]
MAQKAPSRFSVFPYSLFLVLLFCVSCAEDDKEEIAVVFEEVDTTEIPADTVAAVAPELALKNGVYFYHDKPFSGFIVEKYESGVLKSVGSYYQGMQHGLTKTYYPNGNQKDIRSYRENVGYGRHYGYWENGNMRFDFTYYHDKREGLQKQWYESGSPYAFLNFKNDQEHGMQQAWRENGKPYINYEARDGFRYGLQKSALCYTLKDEAVKLTVLK